VLASFLASLSSVDLAYHLRAGGQLLDTGVIPVTDTWTFTAAGAAWLNQQWGAQAILAAVFRIGSWTGLAILRAALVGVTFGCLFEACRRSGLDIRRAAWLTIAAFVVSAVALSLRPQLFGMALLATTLLVLSMRRSHPRLIWIVPLIVLAWANIHGSFFLGPLVVGLAWLEDVHDRVPNPHRTLVVAVVSAAAALINPFGAGVWAYALGLSTNSFVTSRISEWQPTTLRTFPGILFFASAALVVLVLARRGRATSWPAMLWFAVFAAIGTYAIRGVAWWPLGAAFALAGVVTVDLRQRVASATAPAPARAERRSRINVAVVAVIVLACVVLLPIWRPVDPRTGAPNGVVGDAPPGVTDALRSLTAAGDRVLNPQPWGSWFEFSLPDRTYALDSRIEVFPAQVWDDYDKVWHGIEGWQDVLTAWRPAAIVATHTDTELVARLTAAGWRTAFGDADGTVLLPAAAG
jgi:hypothetical protein